MRVAAGASRRSFHQPGAPKVIARKARPNQVRSEMTRRRRLTKSKKPSFSWSRPCTSPYCPSRPCDDEEKVTYATAQEVPFA
jgi:hypothetical protein